MQEHSGSKKIDLTRTPVGQLAMQVAVLRIRQTEARAIRDEKLDEARRNHVNIFLRCYEIEEELGEAEVGLREAAVAYTKETGDLRPCPGVEVKTVAVVVYDMAKGLEWAKKHNMALSLDQKAFKKLVRAAPEAFTGVARMTGTQKAFVATDLAAAFDAAGQSIDVAEVAE